MVPPAASGTGALASTGPVRHQYRHVLVAARTAGHGREVSETPLELQSRASAVTGAGAQFTLREITTVCGRRVRRRADSDEGVSAARVTPRSSSPPCSKTLEESCDKGL